jgi:EAL domain-containing protein (putative c-di-GMP-specific phosphodiesterase class I)
MLGRGGELISPGSFLPVCETYGLIDEIDHWVISEAARIAGTGRRVEVNLSAKSINPQLIDYIDHQLRAAGANPGNLIFELTKTALLGDIDTGQQFAAGLEALGCQLALDDFGTGFASLTYLTRLPTHYLKIDVEFVRDLPTNGTNQHLVKSIVQLAHGLGKETVAEGVENEETLALLRGYGVDYAQGYHLCRPAPIPDYTCS